MTTLTWEAAVACVGEAMNPPNARARVRNESNTRWIARLDALWAPLLTFDMLFLSAGTQRENATNGVVVPLGRRCGAGGPARDLGVFSTMPLVRARAQPDHGTGGRGPMGRRTRAPRPGLVDQRVSRARTMGQCERLYESASWRPWQSGSWRRCRPRSWPSATAPVVGSWSKHRCARSRAPDRLDDGLRRGDDAGWTRRPKGSTLGPFPSMGRLRSRKVLRFRTTKSNYLAIGRSGISAASKPRRIVAGGRVLSLV